MNLYHDLIMDHYKHPRHHGVIHNAHIAAEKFNPLCGDSVRITGLVENNRVTEVLFEGDGCVISQASASMLLDHITGKTTTEILALTPADIIKLINIELGPTRLKCATLSLLTLQLAINKYYAQQQGTDDA